MAEGVDQAERGHSASDNGQDADDEAVKMGLVLAIDDVDGLNFRHEHDSFDRIVGEIDHTRAQGVSVVLLILLPVGAFDNHWNDLQVVEVILPALLFLEILHKLPRLDIALQLLDVVLDILGLVGNWKVEVLASIAEGKVIDLVGHPGLIDELIFEIEDDIVVRSGLEHQSTRRLCQPKLLPSAEAEYPSACI